MSDATRLMEDVFVVCMRYMLNVPDPKESGVHMVKAGGTVAAAGMMQQSGIAPEHTERLYKAAVDGMAAEVKKIRGE